MTLVSNGTVLICFILLHVSSMEFKCCLCFSFVVGVGEEEQLALSEVT